MAEAIAILAAPDQRVWITNPKAGCTMEMMAKDFQVLPAFSQLRDRYADRLAVVAYMNTSGRIKALAGRSGGAVCTSSNASRVLTWVLRQGKKVFFVPDRHLGENVAHQVGIASDRIFLWEGGERGRAASLSTLGQQDLARCDRAEVILWGGFCGVHTIYRPDHVAYWKARGYQVLVHPECPRPVVDAADGAGSTKFLWERVMGASAGSKIAIATEGHFVRNAADQGRLRGVEIVNVADVPNDPFAAMGCGCATMSRNDPPHLVAILDLLRRGSAPELNQVLPGDVVDETSGARQRLSAGEREVLVADARTGLERMIAITRSAA
jgi:quinolinate synthase